MGELVKCKDNGEMIPVEKAFTKSKKNAKNKVYYSSENGFNWYMEWKNKCIDLLIELTLENGMKFSSAAVKLLEENGNPEITYKAMELAKGDIQWAIDSKEFRSEYNKYKYIFAIINSHYNEVVKIEKEKEKQRIEESRDFEFDGDYEIPIKNIENRNVARLIL